MTYVTKRCDCDESRQTKCNHPWYLKQFRWKGTPYAPNLTRYAQDVLQRDLPTKTEAETLAEVVRSSIRAGTYTSAKATQQERPPAPVAGATLNDLTPAFDAAVIATGGRADTLETTRERNRSCLAVFAAFAPGAGLPPFGERDLTTFSIDDIIAFRRSPVMLQRANTTWGTYRDVIVQLFGWAHRAGHLPTDPFATATPMQRRALARGKGGKRRRRITLAEQDWLMLAAGRMRDDAGALRLRALILAAIETGMRRGELLALQWGDIDRAGRTIYVRAVEEGARKTRNPRPVPLSRVLEDELDLMKLDPTGKEWNRIAYVFGDAIGGKVKNIRKAWETCILWAYGHAPAWTPTGALDRKSRDWLKQIDLHFHDLRHEAGCRWLESKLFDLEQIRAIYGHTTIAQTASYLHAESHSAQGAMAAFDADRARQAKAAKEAAKRAAFALKPGRSAHKLHTNGNVAESGTSGPRLVKRWKLQTDKTL